MSENLESKHKVDALKSKILSSELKVFNGYVVFNKYVENIFYITFLHGLQMIKLVIISYNITHSF